MLDPAFPEVWITFGLFSYMSQYIPYKPVWSEWTVYLLLVAEYYSYNTYLSH